MVPFVNLLDKKPLYWLTSLSEHHLYLIWVKVVSHRFDCQCKLHRSGVFFLFLPFCTYLWLSLTKFWPLLVSKTCTNQLNRKWHELLLDGREAHNTALGKALQSKTSDQETLLIIFTGTNHFKHSAVCSLWLQTS